MSEKPPMSAIAVSQMTTTNTVQPPIPESLRPLMNYLESLNGRADLEELSRLLKGLQVTRADLDAWCQFGTRGYRRNTIRRSKWFELLALCWRSGDCTPIHDHTGSSCAFRVIQGHGSEVRFRNTPSGLVCPVSVAEMEPGYVCAAEDADIHQVANMQPPGTDLVTMHIYSPAIESMQTYSPMGVRKTVAWDDDPRGHEPMI
jgi:cysteine dioxygenase